MTEHEFAAPWVQVGPFRLDPVTYTVMLADGRVIALASSEFRVLYDLMSHAGQVRANREILRTVWGTTVSTETAANVVAVYVRRLRQKIEADPVHPRYIVTVRRKGYVFQP
jgi:DNA-binding response OmpR family regulator